MPRPTFLVIGAQRAATTTLYAWLREHPAIFLPRLKETNFLLDVGAWDRGVAWYESLYEAGASHAHRGDVSPAYTLFPRFRHAPERAAEVVPEARLVYLVREPVSRMVSAWAQLVGAGFEHRPLDEALRREAHYTWGSCYALQLERWLAHFERERLLVLRTEDLAADPGGALDRVLAHLGLPPGWRPEQPRALNATAGKQTVPRPLHRAAAALEAAGLARPARALGPTGRLGRRVARPLPPPRLDPGLARDLAALFRDDVARLRALVGPEMDLWGLG